MTKKDIKMNIKLFISISLFLFSGLVNALSIYTDKSDWENALASSIISIEDFEDTTLDEGLLSYTIYDGTYSQLQSFNLVQPESNSQLNTQVFEEIAEQFNDGSLATTVWNFSSPINSFGANWDLANPAGKGTGLAVKVDGQLINQTISSTYTGEFWGFISETQFQNVEILNARNINGLIDDSEIYHMDNLTFAAAVPVPAAQWLLGTGLLGLLGYSRRRS